MTGGGADLAARAVGRRHTVLGLAAAVATWSCTSTPPGPATTRSLRPLGAGLVGRRAVAYSPFRSGDRTTEVVTAAMVAQDLRLLVRAGFGLVRLFDSSDAVARLTLDVIRRQRLDLRVMLGMYVHPGDEAGNQAELDRGIALANAYADLVVALSVGNETMVSWAFVPQETATMVRYIRRVRAATRQPVTTNDNWAFFAAAQGVKPPGPVLAEIDFVAMHTYPLLDTIHSPGSWDWQQRAVPGPARAAAMMDAAIAHAQREFAAVRAHLDASGLSHMPIVIGETGWKAVATDRETQRAHPVNQRMYVERLAAWRQSGRGPANIVYFEAFDEPWKQGDDGWGLFDVERRARPAVQAHFPPRQWAPMPPGGADAARYDEPVADSGRAPLRSRGVAAAAADLSTLAG